MGAAGRSQDHGEQREREAWATVLCDPHADTFAITYHHSHWFPKYQLLLKQLIAYVPNAEAAYCAARRSVKNSLIAARGLRR